MEKNKEKGGGKYLKNKLRQISKRYSGTYFVFGSIVSEYENNYYNTSFVVKDGTILGGYNKNALIYHERRYLNSDEDIFCFEVGSSFKIGVVICCDLMYPEIFRKYLGKVELVVVPSFWGIGANPLQQKYAIQLEKRYYDSIGVARAYENGTALLFVNAAGKYESDFYSDSMMGGSYFVQPPKGITHKNTEKDSNKLYTVNFDEDLLQEYRENYKP